MTLSIFAKAIRGAAKVPIKYETNVLLIVSFPLVLLRLCGLRLAAVANTIHSYEFCAGGFGGCGVGLRFLLVVAAFVLGREVVEAGKRTEGLQAEWGNRRQIRPTA